MTRPTKKTAAATAAEDQQTTPPEVPVEEAATTEPETTTAQAEVVEEQVPPETTPVVEGRPMDTEPERDWSEHNKLVKILLWGVVLVALVVIGVALLMWRNATPKTVENVPSRTSSEVQVDGDPFAALGIHSATEFIVMATKNPSLWDALKLVRPDMTRYDVAGLAAAEQANKPSPWIATVPAGTPIGNTGINGKGHAYSVSGYRVRKGDNTFLVDKNGNIWLKVSCGNPVAPSAPSEAKKPKKPKKTEKTEKCPPAPSGFDPRTSDGGSKEFQNPQDNSKQAKATDPAPDLIRGVPDTIAEDQQDHTGSTDHTPHGAISDDPPPAGLPVDDGDSDVTTGTVPGAW